MTDPHAAAGWYPDPADPSRNLYWDGTQWAEPAANTPATHAPARRSKKASTWSRLRIRQKVLVISLIVTLFGLTLGAIGTFATAGQSEFYKQAHPTMPGKSNAQLVDLAKSACNALESGASGSQVESTFVIQGSISAGNADRFLTAATTAYCPDQGYKVP